MATIGMSPIGARKRVRVRDKTFPIAGGGHQPAKSGHRLSGYQRTIGRCRVAAAVFGIGLAWWLLSQTLLALAEAISGATIPGESIAVICGVLLLVAVTVWYAAAARIRTLQRQGFVVKRTLAVGGGGEISGLVDRLADGTEHPFVVVGAFVEGDGQVVEDVPTVGRLDSHQLTGDPLRDQSPICHVLAAAEQVGADTVCVAPGSGFHGERLRALSWALNDRGVELLTALGVVEVAHNRMKLRRAGGAALIQLMPVRGAGIRRRVKSVADRIIATALLVVLSPVMLAIAVIIRRSDPGPAIYRQERVGYYGKRFVMLKFRSMFIDADCHRADLLGSSDGDGPMFKMREDPRVTKVGRLLRAYSLDELPQLINVIRGDMSLVGPRPPLPEEVAKYDTVEYRRLRTMPGMTGLWQVSGRSNLSWDESVRLDLRYVDNWSLGMDAKLLWRTGHAVFRGNGAY